jgi:hypothetical protein
MRNSRAYVMYWRPLSCIAKILEYWKEKSYHSSINNNATKKDLSNV